MDEDHGIYDLFGLRFGVDDSVKIPNRRHRGIGGLRQQLNRKQVMQYSA